MLLRERVEWRARLPQSRDRVRFGVRPREIGRVELGSDENVSRLDLAGGDAIDADDVITERALEDLAQLSRWKRPDPPLELGDVLTAARPTEIAAGLLRRRIHRLALREQREITAALDLGENRFRLRAGDILRDERRLWRDDDLAEGDRCRLLRKRRAAPLERLLDVAVAHVRRNDLVVLAELLHGALHRLVAPHLLDEHAPILLGSAESRAP